MDEQFTNQEFVERLAAWGFARRKDDGVHTVFRGPHGGTLRVIRSLLGRADAAVAAKAARLAGVTVERFWAGPGQAGEDEGASGAAAPRRRPSAARDRITSLVLGIHAAVDRPLGFDQVVNLSGRRVTRAQVRTASAALCREGDLDRIRSGVYQWSAGARALRAAAPAAEARESRTVRPPTLQPAAAALATPPSTARASAAELFRQLFPGGVRMTAEVLADFEQWAELTERLITHAAS